MPTPLKRDRSVDEERTRALVDRLIDSGIHGLLPLGTSGEFALLTRAERREVVKAVADQANGRVPVFAGVSDPSGGNVLEFSADAKGAGADGVLCTPPYYYRTTEKAVLDYFEHLAEKIDLPLMIYDIPEWTHSFVPPEVLKSLAERELIVGLKYTEYNLLRLLRFIRELSRHRVAVFTGSDAMAFTGIDFGASGAIIGVANVAPRLSSSIFDDYLSGDHLSAKESQLRLLPLIQAIGVGAFPSGLKETMKLAGFPVGPTKEPLPMPSSQEVSLIKRYLKEAEDFH